MAKQIQDTQDSIWTLVKQPKDGDGCGGARLAICRVLAKAPGKRMKRSKLAGLVAKARVSRQDSNYLLSLKKKFLVDGGWITVR
ncbi:MAG: hypothetical protein LAP86_06585 [Acidobacteriia bacterium]|nr:hypothetical protein [Terriglobia bacterium]